MKTIVQRQPKNTRQSGQHGEIYARAGEDCLFYERDFYHIITVVYPWNLIKREICPTRTL